MRIVVYPHDLGIGGSQLNAIEIAAKVRDLGHEAIIFGRPGPLTARIGELGLEFIASPCPQKRPSRAVIRSLAQTIRERDIDVVHGYEWPPALESFLVSRRQQSTAAVATVMSMSVAPFIPRSMPLLVGTEQIAETERRAGRQLVSTLEPPVDLRANNPAVVDGVSDFRTQWGLPADGLTIATVSRLAREMKLEGLLSAIDALAGLNTVVPLSMVIVGDGPARAQVQAHADAVNARAGRQAVVLTGEMNDPRPAYACGDIIFGMGGSALRALAFGKPLVVQGERGFWRLLTEQTVNEFLWTGWYGVGEGAHSGRAVFAREIAPILNDVGLRRSLGEFGRRLVEQRFSLDHAAEAQVKAYEFALERRPGVTREVLDIGRSSALYGGYAMNRKFAKLLDRAPSDDFNSRPVVGTGLSRPTARSGVARSGNPARDDPSLSA